MRHVISIPNLETLDVFEIRHPGTLQNFAEATSLKTFRCNLWMQETDLLEIAKLPKLQELGAHNSDITERSLDALLHMPKLEHLDLEGSTFDDNMAAIVAQSKTLKNLYLGATKLTAKGLKNIAEMSQLRSLDIWHNNITESDLDLLTKLPNLEYLSIGGSEYDGENAIISPLKAKEVIPRLKAIPSLKRVWLDGIELTAEEEKELEDRYDYFLNNYDPL